MKHAPCHCPTCVENAAMRQIAIDFLRGELKRLARIDNATFVDDMLAAYGLKRDALKPDDG